VSNWEGLAICVITLNYNWLIASHYEVFSYPIYVSFAQCYATSVVFYSYILSNAFVV